MAKIDQQDTFAAEGVGGPIYIQDVIDFLKGDSDELVVSLVDAILDVNSKGELLSRILDELRIMNAYNALGHDEVIKIEDLEEI